MEQVTGEMIDYGKRETAARLAEDSTPIPGVGAAVAELRHTVHRLHEVIGLHVERLDSVLLPDSPGDVVSAIASPAPRSTLQAEIADLHDEVHRAGLRVSYLTARLDL